MGVSQILSYRVTGYVFSRRCGVEQKKSDWTPVLALLSLFPMGAAIVYALSISRVVTLQGSDTLLFMQATIIGGLLLAIAGTCVIPLKRWYLFPALILVTVVGYIWTTYMGWGSDTANVSATLVTIFLNVLYLRVFHEFEKRDTPAAATTI